MEYNKTKRGLELASAIIAMICGVSLAVYWIYYCAVFMIPIIEVGTTGSYVFYFILVLAEIFMCCTIITLSAFLIKYPVDIDGAVEDRTSKRIAFLIFSLLTGNIICFALEIVVICLKDFPEKPQPKSNNVNRPAKVSTKVVSENLSIEEKITELRHLKELGVIDDDQYSKAVEKIIKEIAN